MSYTEEQTEEIIAEYEANPSRETVEAISERINKSIRSVIAKLSSAGVYQTPQRTTKTGEQIEKKEEMVTQICTWLGVEANSLAKTGKQDLKRIRDALQDLLGALDE
jgi:Zn-dependent M32 family carboxypeptidase